jgi:hypothetical protein
MKEGKGGADKVKKKAKINKNLNKGDVNIIPRTNNNWRVENIE